MTEADEMRESIMDAAAGLHVLGKIDAFTYGALDDLINSIEDEEKLKLIHDKVVKQLKGGEDE